MEVARSLSLRHISHQNHFAAVKVQKVLRGHWKRLELWKYGGILMVSRVAKIQKCYRGLMGRRKAADIYRKKLLYCAHKIQGLYYRWHSRRLRLRAHLAFLNRGVVLMQSYFRMRAAIQFSNVIRRALHNRKAGMIQRQVRRLLGLRKFQERQRRFQYIYNRLLSQIRAAIQKLSNDNSEWDEDDVTNNSDSPLFRITDMEDADIALNPIEPIEQTPMERQVVAFDSIMCNLLALGNYETVRRISSSMTLIANAPASPARRINNLSTLSGCVGTEADLALTGTYLGLSACWTRAGRMRYTRVDYMEEALGLMMQHSAVAMMKAQRQLQELLVDHGMNNTSGNIMLDRFTGINISATLSSMGDTAGGAAATSASQDSTRMGYKGEEEIFSGLPANRDSLPPWLLALEEDSIDMYYMAILAMQGVTSPYSAMLLLADWVWFQACIHEHIAAADEMVRIHAAAIRTNQIKGSGTARSALTDDFSVEETIPNVHSSVIPGKLSPSPAPLKLADLVAAQTTGNHQLNSIKEETPREEYIDPVYVEHEKRQRAAEFRRKFSIRRVLGLLQRAKKLLSSQSLDRREINFRIEIFNDLHVTEHRALLLEAKSCEMSYRGHYYTEQELINQQRAASAAAKERAASAKMNRVLSGFSSVADGSVLSDVPVLNPVSSSTGTLLVDLQVILCGKTVLIKGSVPLHRLVEAVDDLPPGSALPSSIAQARDSDVLMSYSKSSKSTRKTPKGHKDTISYQNTCPEASILVAVRPFVLMRAEVSELIEQINEELGLVDMANEATAGGGNPHDDQSDANSLGSNSQSLTAGSQLGSQAGGTNSFMGSTNPSHSHSHGQHHGFTQGEYHRLVEYLQQHLRLVSCQDSFTDPSLAQTVREMRALARENYPSAEKYKFSMTDANNPAEHSLFSNFQRLSVAGMNTDAGRSISGIGAGQGTGVGANAASASVAAFSSNNSSAKRTAEPENAFIPPCVPCVRFSLPVIEYRRKIFNESQTVVHATHLLQRVFRGYRGRAKFRRMRWKRNEYERHAMSTLELRKKHDAVRFWRGQRLTVVQRLFRGFRWRKRLYELRVATLIVQCAFRVFRARRAALAERRRRAEGAPVVSMLGNGRGVQVGDRQFTLKIFRSGTNYRLEGVDLLRGAVYEGAVYTPEVMSLIKTHNAGITGTSLYANSQRIMPWQHERVTELIISNLGMMKKITAVSTQLGARTVTQEVQYILVANKEASMTTAPVQPPVSALRLHGSVSEPILELATAHTQKQRLQRYAEYRKNVKFRRQPSHL